MRGERSSHPLRRLIDRHCERQELDPLAVLLLHVEERRHQLAAVGAPRGPELDQHRGLADVLAEVHGLSVESVDRYRRRSRANLDAELLRSAGSRNDKGTDDCGGERKSLTQRADWKNHSRYRSRVNPCLDEK